MNIQRFNVAAWTCAQSSGRSALREHQALGVLRALWLPNQGISLSDGKVATWSDMVSGYQLVQETAASRLAYDADGWDGMPCLVASGAQYMVCTHANWNTYFGGDDANTVIAMAHSVEAPSVLVGIFGASTAHRSCMWISSTMRYLRSSSSYFQGTLGSGLRHHVVRNVGTAGQIWRNGELSASSAIDAASITVSRVAVGAHVTDSAVDNYASGSFGPIAIFSTLDSPAGLTALWNRRGWAHA